MVAGFLYLNTRERIHLYGSKVVYIHVHIRREATKKGMRIKNRLWEFGECLGLSQSVCGLVKTVAGSLTVIVVERAGVCSGSCDQLNLIGSFKLKIPIVFTHSVCTGSSRPFLCSCFMDSLSNKATHTTISCVLPPVHESQHIHSQACDHHMPHTGTRFLPTV